MARKRRTSPFEDLVEIATLLPYWASLSIAVVAYVVLNNFATAEVQPVIQPGSPVPQNIDGMLFRMFATVLQYLVPGAFLLGALVSGIKALRGRMLAKRYVTSPAPVSPVRETHRSSKPTDEMSWQQFELLVGHAFRQAGYSVIDGGEIGADGGVDVHLSKGNKRFFVQCKHWKTKSVGVSVVRELYGVMAGAGASGGFVVTSGSFTEDAKAFAKGKRVGLIDGVKLDRMLRHAKKSVPVSELRQAESAPRAPSCPKCSSSMVKRKARQGKYAGREFWGCSRFPKCKGVFQSR